MAAVKLESSAESSAPSATFKAAISGFAYDSSTPRRSPRKRSASSVIEETLPISPSKKRQVTVKQESVSPKKKKTPTKRGYASPEKYAHLRPLEDHVGVGLDVLFCGFNPGCMSAERGHHFANPTNHFWRALHQGGFVPQFVPADDDDTLPDKYNLGLTNLVERPSAEANELSPAELVASVPTFLRKLARYRPRIVCFVGKGIWLPVQKSLDGQLVKDPKVAAEDVSQAIKEEDAPESSGSSPATAGDSKSPKKSPGKKGKAKDAFEYGLQPYLLVLPAPSANASSSNQLVSQDNLKPEPVDAKFTADSNMNVIATGETLDTASGADITRTLIFVMPSTSGRVVSHQLKDKIVLFAQLKADSDAAKAGTVDTKGFRTVRLDGVMD